MEVHLEEVLDFKRRKSVSRMIEGDDGPFRGSAFFSFCVSICTHMMGECEAAGVTFCYLFSFDVQVVLDESAFTRLRTEFLISGTQSPRDDLGSV